MNERYTGRMGRNGWGQVVDFIVEGWDRLVTSDL